MVTAIGRAAATPPLQRGSAGRTVRKMRKLSLLRAAPPTVLRTVIVLGPVFRAFLRRFVHAPNAANSGECWDPTTPRAVRVSLNPPRPATATLSPPQGKAPGAVGGRGEQRQGLRRPCPVNNAQHISGLDRTSSHTLGLLAQTKRPASRRARAQKEPDNDCRQANYRDVHGLPRANDAGGIHH
jgi:hypothetical protein